MKTKPNNPSIFRDLALILAASFLSCGTEVVADIDAGPDACICDPGDASLDACIPQQDLPACIQGETMAITYDAGVYVNRASFHQTDLPEQKLIFRRPLDGKVLAVYDVTEAVVTLNAETYTPQPDVIGVVTIDFGNSIVLKGTYGKYMGESITVLDHTTAPQISGFQNYVPPAPIVTADTLEITIRTGSINVFQITPTSLRFQAVATLRPQRQGDPNDPETQVYDSIQAEVFYQGTFSYTDAGL